MDESKPSYYKGSDLQITTIDWLWEPYLPFGKVSIIEGDGGDGKTTMILAIAAMLSKGIQPPAMKNGRLQEEKKIKPLNTFYLSIEDGLTDTILPCYTENGGDPKRICFSREKLHHMTLNEEEVLDMIHANNARLLVIDPIQAFLPENTNMANVTSMRKILTMLAHVASTTNTAIVIIGHLNKSEGKKAVHRGLGSADIAAAVRSILLVYMDKNNNRYVKAIKSNFKGADYTPISLVMDDMGKVTFEESDTADDEPPGTSLKIEKAADMIKELLSDGAKPAADIIAACEELRISPKTARRARSKLGADTYTKDGVTVWELR